MTHDSTKDGTCQDIEKRSLVVDVRERGRKEIKKMASIMGVSLGPTNLRTRM
jgi:hypothetical protein